MLRDDRQGAAPRHGAVRVVAEDDVLREVVTLVLKRADYVVHDEAAIVVHAGPDGARIGPPGGGPARFVPSPLWEHVLVAAVGAALAAWTSEDALAAK